MFMCSSIFLYPFVLSQHKHSQPDLEVFNSTIACFLVSKLVMEDQTQTQTQTQTSPSSPRSHEPVRSRWTPKPEQILILESIFNSGMVNPPKEETVKIRKQLEKFGSVGDANVFYWFQNRRSRSRRRQRQIQASLISSGSLEQHHQQQQQQQQQSQMVTPIPNDSMYTTTTQGFVMQQQQPSLFPTLQSFDGSSSSSRLGGVDEIYSISENNTSMPSSFLHLDTSKVQYELASGVITVFINGVPAEVESGPLDMKAMCGDDLILVHSSGVPVPLGEYGVSMPGLEHGESYFLVSRSI